ncbi:MAG: hypothetical protein JXO72_16670 [Vicinamibacteria bacterium]|nr:hypothetical protein [Vicinamibacteria bacterium]
MINKIAAVKARIDEALNFSISETSNISTGNSQNRRTQNSAISIAKRLVPMRIMTSAIMRPRRRCLACQRIVHASIPNPINTMNSIPNAAMNLIGYRMKLKGGMVARTA